MSTFPPPRPPPKPCFLLHYNSHALDCPDFLCPPGRSAAAPPRHPASLPSSCFPSHALPVSRRLRFFDLHVPLQESAAVRAAALRGLRTAASSGAFKKQFVAVNALFWAAVLSPSARDDGPRTAKCCCNERTCSFGSDQASCVSRPPTPPPRAMAPFFGEQQLRSGAALLAGKGASRGAGQMSGAWETWDFVEKDQHTRRWLPQQPKLSVAGALCHPSKPSLHMQTAAQPPCMRLAASVLARPLRPMNDVWSLSARNTVARAELGIGGLGHVDCGEDGERGRGQCGRSTRRASSSRRSGLSSSRACNRSTGGAGHQKGRPLVRSDVSPPHQESNPSN